MNYFINFIRENNIIDYNCIKKYITLLFYFFKNEINHYIEYNIF